MGGRDSHPLGGVHGASASQGQQSAVFPLLEQLRPPVDRRRPRIGLHLVEDRILHRTPLENLRNPVEQARPDHARVGDEEDPLRTEGSDDLGRLVQDVEAEENACGVLELKKTAQIHVRSLPVGNRLRDSGPIAPAPLPDPAAESLPAVRILVPEWIVIKISGDVNSSPGGFRKKGCRRAERETAAGRSRPAPATFRPLDGYPQNTTPGSANYCISTITRKNILRYPRYRRPCRSNSNQCRVPVAGTFPGRRLHLSSAMGSSPAFDSGKRWPFRNHGLTQRRMSCENMEFRDCSRRC